MKSAAERFGLAVVDVRIKRADLPPENSEAVFHRMQTERQQRAAKFRAQGSQQSQQIKAEADRQVTVTIAQAQQEAEQIRGQGDAERNRIFAESYGKDPDFFAFYRSMQAYETGLKAGNSRIVISPEVGLLPLFHDADADRAAPAGDATPETQTVKLRDCARHRSCFRDPGVALAGFASAPTALWRPGDTGAPVVARAAVASRSSGRRGVAESRS